MTHRTATSSEHQIYPKRYFDASPTWFQWNRLTATIMHALREERGFEGQNIYFHLNHPICYVRLVGMVVDIEITGSGRYILISLDDGSGACIEIKTSFRVVKEGDEAEYPSNTVVDNLDVDVGLGVPTLCIDKKPINIGTVIKAKGTIDTFRKTRQLKLERLWIVKNINEEAKSWAETAQWMRDVLSQPWILTQARREGLDEQMRRDASEEREKSRKRKVYDAKYVEKKRKHVEKAESRRWREEEKLNAGALVGSCVLPARVTDS